MPFFKYSIVGWLLVFFSMPASAQRISNENYNNEFSFGVMAHPKGVGIDLRFGRYVSNGRVKYFEAEFLSIRHPKEVRIFNTGITSSNPYTFGKINYAYAARLGYGNKYTLAEKRLKNTASVSFNWAVGPVFTVLKPVYLDLLQTDVNNADYVVSVKVSSQESINQNDVIGNSPFSKGMDELGFRMGAFAKAGFNFDWGDYTDEIKALEIGISLDAFPKRLPLVQYATNKYLFPSFYICAQFGNKW